MCLRYSQCQKERFSVQFQTKEGTERYQENKGSGTLLNILQQLFKYERVHRLIP